MKEKKVEGITVSGKPVVVYQFRLDQVTGFTETLISEYFSENTKFTVLDIKKNFLKFVGVATNLSEKEFGSLYFEDIEQVEKVFWEVNAPLFRYCDRLQKIPVIGAWIGNIAKIFKEDSQRIQAKIQQDLQQIQANQSISESASGVQILPAEGEKKF